MVKIGSFVLWHRQLHCSCENGWHLQRQCRRFVEKRFDTSNYEIDRAIPKEKNKNVIGPIKNELGGEKSWKNFLD